MQRVFVDSNVLGSKTQYDWLFLLKLNCRMFALCTSDDVLDEAHRVWRRKHPTAGSRMRRNRADLFRANFDEIVEVWDGGEAPSLNDVHDTHVHNAAAAARVDILLTNNIRDFGDPATLPYDLYTPDQLFMLIAENSPETVLTVAREQVTYWNRRRDQSPEASQITLSKALISAGCLEFAKKVDSNLLVLTGPTVVTSSPTA